MLKTFRARLAAAIAPAPVPAIPAPDASPVPALPLLPLDNGTLYNCQPGATAPDWRTYERLELAGCRDSAPDMRDAGDMSLSDDETHIEGLQAINRAEFFTVYGRDGATGYADAITDIIDAREALHVAAALALISGLPVTISATLANDERAKA